MQQKTWDKKARHTVTATKLALTDLSIKTRTHQFNIFMKILKPNNRTKVLDVGVTSDEVLADSNLFERIYPYNKNLSAATIEDSVKFRKMYPRLRKVYKIKPGQKLPFRNKQFDVVVSWATLEHVGDYQSQEKFINELIRVGNKIFITTPYRGSIYEPHTGLPFVQWLPLSMFRKICKLTGRMFWSEKKNLNPLYVRDMLRMKLTKNVEIIIYKLFGFIPSHLLIIIS